MVQVRSGKSLTLRKFRTHIKAKPIYNLCAPLVLFLLFANVLAQTPIEFEHCRIYFDSRFKLCHAETLPHNFATSRLEYPLRSRLITFLYSAFICSAVFTEPTLRPSFPPFSIYRFHPDCNRNVMFSRSNCAQVESVAIIIGAKRDCCPSSSNNVSYSFCILLVSDNSLQGAKLSKSTAVNGFAQPNAMGERIVVVRIGSQNLKMVVN